MQEVGAFKILHNNIRGAGDQPGKSKTQHNQKGKINMEQFQSANKTNLETKTKIKKIMESGCCPDAPERLTRAIIETFNADGASHEKIGCYLFKAFLEDNVSDAIAALCGWSFEDLMIKAGILPDTEGLFAKGTKTK